MSPAPDHPRVCGEKLHQRFVVRIRVGSPPRMRGKVERLCQSDCRIGITPAYAGKRNAQRLGASGSRDHPRICGEKYFFVEDCLLADRITPAYAGKSRRDAADTCGRQDHPRICGEKIVVSRTWCSRSGLPPRMRGKEKPLQEAAGREGITPAYAGKSYKFLVVVNHNEDHPRVCGEKGRHGLRRYDVPGSPPRMRGKVNHDDCTNTKERITPAYAGKRR